MSRLAAMSRRRTPADARPAVRRREPADRGGRSGQADLLAGGSTLITPAYIGGLAASVQANFMAAA
jgi:hypothetical protein